MVIYEEEFYNMGFIGTKLKGLAALIAAAAVTLTALPTTAAAENAVFRRGENCRKMGKSGNGIIDKINC